MISKERYHRGTRVEVDLDAISKNVYNLRSYLPSDVEIIAVVKANGYGHGAVQVSRTALASGATYLAVACLDEALSLRANGIEVPMLVLGSTEVGYMKTALKYDITLTVFDVHWLKEAKAILEQSDQKLKIHIKVDTGMGRLGVRTKQELSEVLEQIDERAFDLEGIFTHFATADDEDESHYKNQLRVFEGFLSELKSKPRLVHVSNSAAILRYPESNFNAVRFGISLYGYEPSAAVAAVLPFELETAFSLQTKIAQVKKVSKGTKIGYGATYVAASDEWIATIPIGYADGWFRCLQGQEVLVDGVRTPIVGRVCMDQCMIKLPHEVPVGTNVTLIGKSQSDEVTVSEIAKKVGTIDHEVICGISVRVPRVYKEKGKIVEINNGLF